MNYDIIQQKSKHADLDFQRHKDKNIKFNQRTKTINVFEFIDFFLIIFIQNLSIGEKSTETHINTSSFKINQRIKVLF